MGPSFWFWRVPGRPGCLTAGGNDPTQGRGGSAWRDSCGHWWKLESKDRALFQIQYTYFC